jgi:hypothetical protein
MILELEGNTVTGVVQRHESQTMAEFHMLEEFQRLHPQAMLLANLNGKANVVIETDTQGVPRIGIHVRRFPRYSDGRKTGEGLRGAGTYYNVKDAVKRLCDLS